jgi:hypothetical protein
LECRPEATFSFGYEYRPVSCSTNAPRSCRALGETFPNTLVIEAHACIWPQTHALPLVAMVLVIIHQVPLSVHVLGFQSSKNDFLFNRNLESRVGEVSPSLQPKLDFAVVRR